MEVSTNNLNLGLSTNLFSSNSSINTKNYTNKKLY